MSIIQWYTNVIHMYIITKCMCLNYVSLGHGTFDNDFCDKNTNQYFPTYSDCMGAANMYVRPRVSYLNLLL